jgi:alcohol dehydrogenase (cytochrome c)
LTQITPENAGDLVLKWVFQSQSTEKHEVTPLVVDGVMYTIESPNGVVALNAETGAILWRYTHTPHEAARNCCGRLSRGLAILDDKIFLAAFDARMIALDARTGQELWNTAAGDPTQAEAFTHAPLVVGDKVLAGTAGGEFGVRGWIAAFDVDTGEEVWRFFTVPGPGEPGNETWGGDSWEHGGAPIWVTGSYDPELNLTYWGTGNPGPDWDGSVRPGDNLYSCSVIALNADTGELVWHYQFFPHNEFDWDATQTPVLVDMEFEGQMRKTMLFANRSGVYYVLDRETGEFLLGRSFVRTNWVDGFDADGRPRQVIFPTPEGTQVFPGNQGGTNWYPPSYSPATGLVYIPTWENTASIYRTAEEPTEFHEGQTFAGPFPGRSATGEEYSAVRALDPATGEKVWDYVQTAPSTEAGILTTASNVLFSGSRDGHFYALDARDGTLLWENVNLGASVSAGPMSYAVNGEQYVAIQVGRALYAFGLPE